MDINIRLKVPAAIHKKPAAYAPGQHLIPPGGSDGLPEGERFDLLLLFLDIDGVLNSVKTLCATGERPDTNEDLVVTGLDSSDRISAMLINQLCGITGARIVISSSWRKILPFDNLLVALEGMGIATANVIGTIDAVGPTRGDEIYRFVSCVERPHGRNWLSRVDCLKKGALPEDKRIKVKNYVILDDLDQEELLEFQEHSLIKVDPIEGLTLKNVIDAGKILTDDETFYINRLRGLGSVQ